MRSGKCRLFSLALLCAMILPACGGGGDADEGSEEILLTFRDESLTREEVVDKIPVAISYEDSIALFQEIVDNWIASKVIAEFAETQLPDIDEIDRKVDAYRRRLIVAEYLQEMKEGKKLTVSDDSIRRFYDIHRSEMLTERPLIKGIYLKIPSSSTRLDEVRRLVFDGGDASIDRLETDYAAEAVQYDYFANAWVDWQTVADLIPYRFYDPDAFLESTRNFETSYNGSTYFLKVTEYLPSGSEQPFEFAKERIASLMMQSKMALFEESSGSSMGKK
ncbi:MAG: hypothetical protein K2M10_05220, partial [Muribaculaceae bacterium]|nr:hypothetical protein [Muribaculaceae bacterium]